MKIVLSLAAMLFTTTPLFAEPITFESGPAPVALLELFTSEGCSGCPPADAWLSKLKTSPALWKSVVPVAFHVDYWNQLGWPDRFSTHANTERQQRYAAAWRSRSVYTPGFVLDGREWRDWSSQALPAPSSSAKAGALRVTLRDRTHADVTFTPTGGGPKPQRVELALLGGNLDSDVQRGENGGRKLHHDFVVLQLVTSALTADGASFTASLVLPEKPLSPQWPWPHGSRAAKPSHPCKRREAGWPRASLDAHLLAETANSHHPRPA